VQVIRGRFYMQLTDRVLLPATFSYAGGVQNSSSPHANGATQQTEAATETGSNDVTLPNATDEGQIDGVEITNACGIISSVETDKQASATDHGGLNPLNTAGGISVMTMSLVDFPTYIHSVVEVQPLPLTAVHVDGTLQHSADAANIVVTDSTVPSDGQSCNDVAVSTMPVSSIFTNCDDAALVQQPAEWTRYAAAFCLLKLHFSYLMCSLYIMLFNVLLMCISDIWFNPTDGQVLVMWCLKSS